jgi:uncharacterized membrane protein YidH (DUF202 family)
MKTRAVVGIVLVLLGMGGIVLGAMGWTRSQELIDASVLEVTVQTRETSPLMAALGGIALVTGIVTLWSARERGALI